MTLCHKNDNCCVVKKFSCVFFPGVVYALKQSKVMIPLFLVISAAIAYIALLHSMNAVLE